MAWVPWESSAGGCGLCEWTEQCRALESGPVAGVVVGERGLVPSETPAGSGATLANAPST